MDLLEAPLPGREVCAADSPAPPVGVPLQPVADQETSHEEVQWSLLEMGASLGLDVWVAHNDRNRSFGGHAFQDAPRLKEALSRQFEPQVMSLIEHIDVLWMRGSRVEAAFEVEHTTTVSSRLLRMSDLITLHPNLMRSASPSSRLTPARRRS